MKDPAVLFYTSDFLTGTAFFSDAERGQYIRLLCEQHQLYSIPENHMIYVCGSIDSIVIKKFTRDDQGNYYNQRMRVEAEKRSKYCESRKNNKSGRKPKKIISKTYDLHMGNENENENENDNENIFNEFRIIYPGTKKGNKTEFENFKKKHKDWKTVLPQLKSIVQNQIGVKKEMKEKGKFVPEWKNLQTWINQRCWEEEFNFTTNITQRKLIMPT